MYNFDSHSASRPSSISSVSPSAILDASRRLQGQEGCGGGPEAVRWKRKGTRGQRGVNDLSYRSLPVHSSRNVFLPALESTIEPVSSWNNCYRRVDSTGRTKRERPHCRYTFPVFCGLFRTGYNQALCRPALFRRSFLKRYLVNEHATEPVVSRVLFRSAIARDPLCRRGR